MLSPKQRAKLASLAQRAESLASLGKAGLTEAFVSRLDVLLGDHELVKLRLGALPEGDRKEGRRVLAAELAQRTRSELVTLIGNVAVFFRRQDKPERRKVELGDEE
jgi:RNA-binding protein